MKFFKYVFALVALSVSSGAVADVTVKLHRDLEFMVINGEELGFNFGTQKEQVLPNGQNQLVIRMSKLLPNGSSHDKFNSRPIVVTFDASDTEFEFSPTRRIESERDISGFDQKPSVKIEGENHVEFHQGILLRGPGILPDLARDLALYNKKNGMQGSVQTVVESSKTPVATASVPVVATQATSASAQITNNAFILLQADFLRMSPEQQKAFLSWAVQNVK
ncbi:hypothetical protein BCT30_21725 [Enterovibrio norvegicus]|uniref:YccT family protein n=1 Tax=Enterovibrio norvegicus TaxID=188144 RepID=UPI000C81F98B|nr:DUF2057 family protein [Enterovibrio norvegicus]MCC4798974.1 DUF2057 domain-containing protein [Enterovibrio norvegicus]PMH63178.1 hypothetical protein BCU62_18770 [Enterovibrio norvegicus]PMI29388.1 hypothetical protein BCU47_19935 [Enterovibrio norvegicus]PMI37833.1 hypothetical protein BCU46_09940 [Enterovibrio norvegicus]PMN46422.1 hypothetical protein BCT30_21725 [Enterovibrio norvegicus]